MRVMSPERASAVIRRQRVLLVIALVAIIACIAGLLASQYVKSPQQITAEQSPPPRSTITAPVLSQVLTQTVSVRGTVDVVSTINIVNRIMASPAIVTRLPVLRGNEVGQGQVIAEVSGHPIFVMTGAIPAYRGLVSGDKGADVKQLQEGLQALGLLTDPTWGTFDRQTQVAVTKLYGDAGYGDPGSVPLGEIVFIPQLPATVGSVAVAVGDEVSGAILTLQAGSPVVHAMIPAGQEQVVAAGQAVVVDEELNRRSGAGVVESMGEFTVPNVEMGGAPGSQVAGFPVTIAASEGIDASWVGASVAVKITIGSTESEVLTVPLAAIQTGADARTYVTVGDAGNMRNVDVTTGLVANGFVEITPASSESLLAGDEVVVG